MTVTTGDEVLDWHEALRAYPASPQYVIEGSDHAVSDIDRYADALTDFLVNGTLPLKRAAISAGRSAKAYSFGQPSQRKALKPCSYFLKKTVFLRRVTF